MKKVLLVVGLGLMAVSAFAADKLDTITLSAQDRDSVVNISGQDNGLASELFMAYRKAGLDKIHYMEGAKFFGKNLDASLYMMGRKFYAEFRIPAGSGKVEGFKNRSQNGALFTGDTAEELYHVLLKAGFKNSNRIGANTVYGKLVYCTSTVTRARNFSCTVVDRMILPRD